MKEKIKGQEKCQRLMDVQAERGSNYPSISEIQSILQTHPEMFSACSINVLGCPG